MRLDNQCIARVAGEWRYLGAALRLVSIWALSRVITPVDLFAEAKTLTIAESMRVAGEPDHAHVVMQRTDNSVVVFPAALVLVSGTDEVAVVARVSVDTENPPTRAVVTLFGKTGEIASRVRPMEDILEHPELTLEASELQARVNERRNSIKEWESRVSEQSSNLQRLREDADLITNVGQIVTKEDEVEVIRRDIQRFRAALMGARERLTALQRKVPIPNEQGRLAQLTTELSTLASALKKSEEQAEQRFSSVSSEFQEKMKLIESTKNERIDLLKKELDELQQEQPVRN